MTFMMLRFPLALVAMATLSSAARAQDDPGALAAATRQLDSGMTLARRQIGASDLLGALGTLELQRRRCGGWLGDVRGAMVRRIRHDGA